MNAAHFLPLALSIVCGAAGAQVRQDEHAAVIDLRGAAVTSGFDL